MYNILDEGNAAQVCDPSKVYLRFLEYVYSHSSTYIVLEKHKPHDNFQYHFVIKHYL